MQFTRSPRGSVRQAAWTTKTLPDYFTHPGNDT
jgi:hypothetical protein